MKQILITLILSLLVTNAFASGECKEGETAYTNKCLNNNCTFCYNSKTEDLRIVPNSDVQEGDAVIIKSNVWNHANNVTIEEGITGSEPCIFGYGEGSCATCTLKIPSTFNDLRTSWYRNQPEPFWYNSFGTVDLSDAKNLNLSLPTEKSQKIILDPNSNVTVNSSVWYNPQNTSKIKLTIQCKGADLKACQDMVTTGKNLSVEYYQGTDEKGNIVEVWDKNGKKTYSYNYLANGDYKKYDGDGNFLGSFMADGSKRRIYRVDEAAAVTGLKNTFSIKYR